MSFSPFHPSNGIYATRLVFGIKRTSPGYEKKTERHVTATTQLTFRS